jgi:hypothetical protein
VNDEALRALLALSIQRYGLAETARRLHLAKMPVLRLMAGETVRRSTIECARALAPQLEGQGVSYSSGTGR